MPAKLEKRNKELMLKGQMHSRILSLRKVETDNEKSEITFAMVSKDNGGKRYDWWEGEYFEERLEIAGADTSQLRTFFKDHHISVDTAIGKVSNVRVDNGDLLADVTFGSDEASKIVEQKYRDGILTDVSIGYEIISYSVEKREDDIDLVTVESFIIRELSAVGMGFDSGAKKRKKEDVMPKKIDDKVEVAENAETTIKTEMRSAEVDSKLSDLQSQLDESKRKEQVRAVCAERSASPELLARFLKEGSVIELREAILDEAEKRQKTIVTDVRDFGGNKKEMMNDMSAGLAMRMGVNIEDASREAHQYSRASLLDFGRDLVQGRTYGSLELANRTLVTPDFPLLLESAGARILKQNFNEEMGTWADWTSQTDVVDFRTQTDVTFGMGGELPRLYEGGELTEGEADEYAEEWKIASYGKVFTLTRQMLINDDLRALNRMFTDFGIMANRTINGHVYRLLQAQGEYVNYKMADGSGIFVTGHNNKQALDLNAENLGKARALMRKQKDLSGNPLNIAPSNLIVGADLEQMALQLLNSTASLDDNKNSGVVNTHYKTLAPVIENAIAGDAWYLTTDRRTVQVGFLQGTGRAPVTNIIDTSIQGVSIEGLIDFGVMAEDFRGMVKGK